MAKRPVVPSPQDTPLPQQIWGAIKDAVPPMHEAGRPFVAGALTFGLFGWRYGWSRRTSLLAAGALALCFREPKRVPATLPGAVASPADGVVKGFDEAVPPAELGLGDKPLPRVKISVSVLDPYVLRAPVAGRVTAIAEDGGAVGIETSDGTALGLVQTPSNPAGRISCDVAVDQELALGETYALARFGSLVELYLPAGTTVRLATGQRTIASETVLAVLS